jgi:hypothetical protein
MAKASTLIDNFNDNSTGSQWALIDPTPTLQRIREVNGRVEIRPRSNESAYLGYNSATAYDLTDSQAHVELVQPLRNAATANTILGAYPDASNGIALRVSGGELTYEQTVSGTYTKIDSRPMIR